MISSPPAEALPVATDSLPSISPTPKPPIRAAVVGLGRAGWFLHFKPLSEDSRFQIAAVVDPDAQRAEEAAQLTGCRTYRTLAEALAEGGIDLVVIATPSEFHEADAKTALAAGVDVVLEKPMATSFEGARSVIEAASRQGRKLFVHHQHLFLPIYAHLRKVIDSGVLGPIFGIQVAWNQYNRRWDWQALKKNGGGQLNNTCPHLLSTVLPLLPGRVTACAAHLYNAKDFGDAEDHVEILLKTDQGAFANLTVTSACAVPSRRWAILGKYGALESNGTTSKLRYYDPATAPAHEVIDAPAPNRQYLTETLEWKEETLSVEGTSTASFYDEVASSILEDGEVRLSPEGALDVMRVIEMVRDGAL